MKRDGFKLALIEILVLSMILLLGFTILNQEYLFAWIAHNWIFYLFLSLAVLFLIAFKKKIISILMTLGIFVGSFLGNYLGGFIRANNIKKIIDGMTGEEVYRMQHHPGFEIWIGTIVFFLLIGIILNLFIKRNKI